MTDVFVMIIKKYFHLSLGTQTGIWLGYAYDNYLGKVNELTY